MSTAASEASKPVEGAGEQGRPPSQTEDDGVVYQVVINHEEQYSIWPDYRGEPPAGWTCVGVRGPKAQCLEHINEVWTDMRPKSLRLRMAELEEASPAAEEEVAPIDARDDLVTFLATGTHPVKASVRPEATATLFKSAIDRGYVHISFTDTRGGTELAVRLAPGDCDLVDADFTSAWGRIHLEGTLALDDVPVRCIADIDLATLCGAGFLRRAEEHHSGTTSDIAQLAQR